MRNGLLAGLALSMAAIAGCGHGTKLSFKSGELYYTKNVTEDEAQKLGKFLVKAKYFTDDKKVSVQLDREEDVYQVRMVVQDDYKSMKKIYPLAYQVLAQRFSKKVFDGKPVEIHLTDKNLKTHEVIQPLEISASRKQPATGGNG